MALKTNTNSVQDPLIYIEQANIMWKYCNGSKSLYIKNITNLTCDTQSQFPSKLNIFIAG